MVPSSFHHLTSWPAMAAYRSKVQQFLVQSVVPIACSIVVGFVFFGGEVFNRHTGAFQFLWSAVVASVFYYLLVLARPRDAYLGFIILLCLTFLTTGSRHLSYILRDIFFIGAIGLSIFLYFKYYRNQASHTFGYPAFMLAGIYAVLYIIAVECHMVILQTFAMEHSGGNATSLATAGAFYGVLIGFAVGAGIALNEKLIERN